MTAINVTSAKLAIVFRPGDLPKVNPNDPTMLLDLGGFKIAVRVNAKSARKLAVHDGGAVL